MQVNVRNLVGWYSFEVNGLEYMLLLNGERMGFFTTGLGSDGSDGDYEPANIKQTVLFRWQGSLIPVQVRSRNIKL